MEEKPKLSRWRSNTMSKEKINLSLVRAGPWRSICSPIQLLPEQPSEVLREFLSQRANSTEKREEEVVGDASSCCLPSLGGMSGAPRPTCGNDFDIDSFATIFNSQKQLMRITK